ncbi:MAG: class I SAM-dependent methyltransferase [Candidatus Sericytochromatia bacterium]
MSEQTPSDFWDYSELAEAYLKRPDYADEALERMLAPMQLPPGARVCDVGAGVAHLTLQLARRGFDVTAVEPNDRMRALGQQRTAELDQVHWHQGTGEATGQPDQAFALVSFGSSFNVCDREAALRETCRILQPRGWFACLWNHRDLDDPLQGEIETLIRSFLPEYGYGTRRQDQTEPIVASGLFEAVQSVSGRVIHSQSLEDCVTAWRSHATLQRQAGARFPEIVAAIESLLRSRGQASIRIPYDTRVWFARKLS